MTVSEAFQEFKSHLELPASHSERASAAQQELRTRLGRHLDIQESFLTGSYARHTKIHPLNDIDVMLVRNSVRVGLASGGGILPLDALDGVVHAARAAFPNGVTVNRQSRSVNLSFAGLDFGFDLIPAWLRNPDGFWIPDVSIGSWIPTDPHSHERLMTEANQRSGGRLKPVIKMIKHWSRHNYDLLCSFHVELICERAFRGLNIDSYQVGVASVLISLPAFIGTPAMDPAYGLNRVDKPLSGQELANLGNRANYDAGNARTAIQLERSGRHEDAIAVWKHIFVGGFPR
jgi:hypothetical protein